MGRNFASEPGRAISRWGALLRAGGAQNATLRPECHDIRAIAHRTHAERPNELGLPALAKWIRECKWMPEYGKANLTFLNSFLEWAQAENLAATPMTWRTNCLGRGHRATGTRGSYRVMSRLDGTRRLFLNRRLLRDRIHFDDDAFAVAQHYDEHGVLPEWGRGISQSHPFDCTQDW